MYRMRRFIFLLYVSMVFSKDIFGAIYMKYIKGFVPIRKKVLSPSGKRFLSSFGKRFCPHSVSKILLMHIPAPNPNLLASESIPID
jgi:hypothetical protein